MNHPTAVFLTGWLFGATSREGKGAMKIADVRPTTDSRLAYTAFDVELASGTVLRVRVEVKKAAEEAEPLEEPK